MTHDFRTIQGCPCPMLSAPFIAIVVNDAKATVNSIYRGVDAAVILHKHDKHTQAELYDMYLHGHGAPANQPGFSTHELKSDGIAYHVSRGKDLAWWQMGFDVNDKDVHNVIHVASVYGWHLWQPYRAGSEYHHLNFRTQPRPSAQIKPRVDRLRETLPRS